MSENWTKSFDGLDYGPLTAESDVSQALDLRFNHFLQNEPLMKSLGGVPHHTKEMKDRGKYLMSGEGTIVCKDPKEGGKVVGFLVRKRHTKVEEKAVWKVYFRPVGWRTRKTTPRQHMGNR